MAEVISDFPQAPGSIPPPVWAIAPVILPVDRDEVDSPTAKYARLPSVMGAPSRAGSAGRQDSASSTRRRLMPPAAGGVVANPVAPTAAARVREQSFVRLTFLLFGRPAIHLRIPTRASRVAVCSLCISPLLLGMAGFVARGAVEFPEVRAMKTNASSPLLATTRAPFSFEPTVRRLLWNTAPERRAARLGLGTALVASQLLGGRPAEAWVRTAGELASAPKTLAWPVPRGWFVRGYGSGEGGYHRAVDIAADIGADVVAAAPGIVAYVGNEIRGYGNIVLLVHPGGLVTLYAHNQKNHVKVGQAVRRGEVIAAVGSTGISRGPHVHFEMLHGGKNCDPVPLFRPYARHRSGAVSEVPRREWNIDARGVAPVRCGRRLSHPSRHGSDAGY